MMNKYARSSSSIKTVSEQESTYTSVYEEFLKNIGKYSAQSESSMHEEINAILTGAQPKFSNVEEVVQDMKERSGLKAFMEAKTAIAFIQEPEIFQKIPAMKAFIDNYTESRPGTSIESVIHDLLKMDSVRDKLEDGTDVSSEVRSYINDRLGEARKDHNDHNSVNMHVGKIDQSTPETSNDPLAICEPNRAK